MPLPRQRMQPPGQKQIRITSLRGNSAQIQHLRARAIIVRRGLAKSAAAWHERPASNDARRTTTMRKPESTKVLSTCRHCSTGWARGIIAKARQIRGGHTFFRCRLRQSPFQNLFADIQAASSQRLQQSLRRCRLQLCANHPQASRQAAMHAASLSSKGATSTETTK